MLLLYPQQLFLSLVSVFASLFIRHLLAQPSHALSATLVTGVRNGNSADKQYYEPGKTLEMVIFGENLNISAIGSIFLTDAGRCGDVDDLEKTRIPLFPNLAYDDRTALVVRTKDAIPKDISSTLRLCLSTAAKNYTPPKTAWLYPYPEEEYIIPLPFLILAYIITLSISACLSGLCLAYSILPLEHLDMLINKKSDNPEDQKKMKQAKNVLPLRKRSNWLIATFAIANTIVNIFSTLIAQEMFLKLPPKTEIILINTVPVILTMLFGEILPQGLCNKRALSVASNLRFIVIIAVVIFAPIAWPLSRILDLVLGQEPFRVYDLKSLSILISEHAPNKEIIGNVVKFQSLKIGKIMTRIEDAYLLSRHDILDMTRMVGILEKGFTRVPVYEGLERKKVVAVLNVKDLILINPKEKKRVCDFLDYVEKFKNTSTFELRFVSQDMLAQDVMSEMVKGSQHLMMVYRFENKSYSIIGLVTLEDIIEEFIGEIKDDEDVAFPSIRAGFRRDQSTLDWFREEVDKTTGLSANEMLKLIQQILKQCPSFSKLNLNIYAMRVLITVSKIRHYENNVIIAKGASMRSLYIAIYGQIKKGKNGIAQEHPVFGNKLLEEFCNRICNNFDDAQFNDIEYVNDSEPIVCSSKAIILQIELHDIYRLLRVLEHESSNEDSLAQFDHYLHMMQLLHPTYGMNASMEDATQNINLPQLKEEFEVTAIGLPEFGKEKQRTNPKEKIQTTAINMDAKMEQKTQLLVGGESSRKSKKPIKESKASKKEIRNTTQSRNTAAPIADADETDNVTTIIEDKTQASSPRP